MFPTTLLILAVATTTPVLARAELPVLRGAILLPRLDGLPVFAALQIRQAGSETCAAATETLCADGNGCCPIGEACGYTTSAGATYGICEGFCNVGAITCTTPITACCNANEICGADGTCTAGYGATTTAPGVTATASYPAPSLTFAPVASPAMTLPLSVSTSINDFWSSESVYESSLAASESSWEASFDASTSSYWASYDASQSMAGASAAASGSPVAASLSATSPAAAAAAAAASVTGASGDGAQLAVGRDGLRFLMGMLTLTLWWG